MPVTPTTTENPPTERQLEVLRALHEYREAQGRSPTHRDLMALLGIANPSGIVCHLRPLEAKGLVSREGFTARSLAPTARGRLALGLSPGYGGVRREGAVFLLTLDGRDHELSPTRARELADDLRRLLAGEMAESPPRELTATGATR